MSRLEPLPTLVQQGPTASGVQIGPNGAAPLRERSAPAPRALMSRPALGCGAAKRANATSGHQRYRGPGKASGDDIMAVLQLTADYQLWNPREDRTSSSLGNKEKFRDPLGNFWDIPIRRQRTMKRFGVNVDPFAWIRFN